MSNNRPRYITGADSISRTQLQSGMTQAKKLVKYDQGECITISCHSKDVFERLSKRIFNDPKITKYLWINRKSNDQIKVFTDRDDLPYNIRGPLLMVYPKANRLNSVSSAHGFTCEIVVPCDENNEAIIRWQETWLPSPIGDATHSQPHAIPTLSPIAKIALHSLSCKINLSSPLSHPNDHNSTIRIFETLLEYESNLDSNSVRSHLVSVENWPGDDADQAIKILDDLSAGKSIHGRVGPDEALYQGWRDKAGKNTEY